MNGTKTILLCCGLDLAVILFVTAANYFDCSLYAIFYNLGYGLIMSVFVPLLLLRRYGNPLAQIGLASLKRRQWIVLASFVAASVGGQLIPLFLEGQAIDWGLLPIGVLPLVMTTFFEELLFQGFMQTQLEKSFGAIPAIVLSGAFFALYHLGYPGFRTIPDISLLFAVGIMFAVAFKLSRNNLVVAYFVNLPNAFITYVLKNAQFPTMTFASDIFALVTILIIAGVLFWFAKTSARSRNRTNRPSLTK